MENRSALIAGASGLIGSELLQLLVKDNFYHKIYVLTRRTLDIPKEKAEQLVVDFDAFRAEELPKVQDVYCCLGTTMSGAGSKTAFRKVDYHYPLKIAELCRKNGAEQYMLVSSMGADKNSRFFYNQVKGEVEETLAAVGYPALHIFRPSISLGEREEKRTGEKIAQVLMKAASPLMISKLKNYRPIHGKAVAEGMFVAARQKLQGPHLFESAQIKVLAKEYEKEAKLKTFNL
ncbi:MAG: oxidoreductase [Cyclobacteriaceae bacterium]